MLPLRGLSRPGSGRSEPQDIELPPPVPLRPQGAKPAHERATTYAAAFSRGDGRTGSRGLSDARRAAIYRHPRAGRDPEQQELQMTESMYPQASHALAAKRRELAPEIEAAFRQFSQATFRDGALPGKTKQLIAVAVAHVTQCPYCIKGHTKAALRDGATPEELMEAIWVAVEMRAGAAYAHSALALDTIEAAKRASARPMKNWTRRA